MGEREAGLPYSILVARGGGLRAAPGVELRAGDLRFRLVDHAGAAVPNAPIEFQAGFGGGEVRRVNPTFGFVERATSIRLTTDSAGEVDAPRFALGPRPGPQALFVQADHAHLEHIVAADYSSTVIEIVSPLPADRKGVCGGVFRAEFRAVDRGYHDLPVPDLPVEIDLETGSGLINTLDGSPGVYDLRRTSPDGLVAITGNFGRRAEPLSWRVSAYRDPGITAARLTYDLRPPSLLPYSELLVRRAPVGSVPIPLRSNVSDSEDRVLDVTDRDLTGVVVRVEERQGRVDVHPPTGGEQDPTSSFTWTSDQPTPYQLVARLPDYPDEPRTTHSGELPAELRDGVPAPTSAGLLATGFRGYVQLAGGGNRDDGHYLAADLIAGTVQYVGPNATSGPITARVVVSPFNPPHRLVEARVKFKVRMTPYNSVVDDPGSGSTTRIPGAVGPTSAGPWGDELTLTVPGQPGPHDLTVFFRSNERNHDHLVDVTCEVTMEDEDSNGNLVQFDEDGELLLRASLPRPRLYLARQEGPDVVPLDEPGVLPVSVQDAAGAYVPPPLRSAFFVELRAHDLGASVQCTVRAGTQRRITLTRVAVGPTHATYRSEPCFAVLDDGFSGAGIPAPAGAEELFFARPGDLVRAWMTDEMPGNTLQPDPVRYSAGVRPLTTFHRVTVGDAGAADQAPRPFLHVQVEDDASWPTRVRGTTPQVQVRGRVQCQLADLAGPRPTEVLVDGVGVPLTRVVEASTTGRPEAAIYTFDAFVDVRFGVQGIVVEVTNVLGGRSVRRFEIDVDEAANNRAAPASVTAAVRPVDTFRRDPLPVFHYLAALGTYLGQGVTMTPQWPAEVASLEPFPGTAVRSTIPVSMKQRATVANQAASTPFLTLREDLAPAGAALGPVLLMPLGGRLQWQTASLPNELGPLPLVGRRVHPVREFTLQRWDSAASGWADADVAIVGDELRLICRTFPAAQVPQIDARLVVADPTGRPLEGPDRSRDLILTELGPGQFALSGWLDVSFAAQTGDSITLSMHHDAAPAAGQVPLRTDGPGRLLLETGSARDRGTVDVPLQVRPSRTVRSGDPVEQEGVGAPAGRLGAMASVVPGTGELVLQCDDRTLESRGMATVWERTYRSANRYDGPLGPGWMPRFHRRIFEIDGDTVLLFEADGHQLTFRRDPNGAWDPPPGVFAKLESWPGGWRLCRRGGVSDVFLPSADGAEFGWAAREDRWGNRIRAIRGNHGRILAVRDTLGRDIQLRWADGTGRLEGLGDFGGSTVRFTYFGTGDADGWHGNLKSVRSPIVANPDNPFPQGRTWTYHYEPPEQDHRLKWVQDPVGVAGSLPTLLDIDYDADGHVETQRYPRGSYTFARTGDVLTWTDRRQTSHTIELHPAAGDGFAQLPHRQTANVSGVDRTHTQEWNDQRSLVRHVKPLGDATELLWDHQAPDPRDRGCLLRRAQLPDGVRPAIVLRTAGVTSFASVPAPVTVTELTESWRYDPANQQIREHTDELGRVTTWAFTGPLLDSVTHPTVTHTTGGAPQARAESFTWNRWGQLLVSIDEVGVATRYSYHPASDPTGAGGGAPVSAEDEPGGFLARIEVDVADPNASRAAHLAPRRTVFERYAHDRYGWQTKVEDALGHAVETTLNELGEPIRLTDPDGGVVRLRYDHNARLTDRIQEVRDLGLPSGVTAAAAHEVREHFEYERDDHANERIVDADGLKLTWTWAHDGEGNVTDSTTPRVHATTHPDPNAVTHCEYDEANACTAVVEGFGSNNPVRVEVGYDDNGVMDTRAWPSTGRRVSIKRDGFNRFVGQEDALGNLDLLMLDDVGNVTARTMRGSLDGDPNHVGLLSEDVLFYDEADRKIARRTRSFLHRPPVGSGPPTVEDIGTGNVLTTWYWDARGTLIRKVEPTGLQTDTTPDGHGLKQSVTDNAGSSAVFVQDARNLLSSATHTDGAGSLTTTLEYTPGGRLRVERRGSDVVSRTWFDTRGLTRVIEDGVGNRTVTRWDDAARPVEVDTLMYLDGARTPTVGGPNPLQSTLTATTEYYADGRTRRLTDNRGHTAATMEFDSTGRLTRRTLPDDALRLPGGTTVDQNPGDEEYTYVYRGDGLLDHVTDPDGRRITMSWDAAGRSTGMSVAAAPGRSPSIAGSRSVNWTLDGLGRAVGATDDNGPGAGSSTVRRTFTSLGDVADDVQTEDLAGAARTRAVASEHLRDGRPVFLRYPGTGAPRVRAVPDVYGNTDYVAENAGNVTLVDCEYDGRYFSYKSFANGIRYGWAYDAEKDVGEIRSFTGNDFNDLANALSARRFVYDARKLAVTELDLKTNRLARLRYDSQGRLDARVDGHVPSQPGAVPRSAAGEPNARYWTYDDGGNPISVEAGLVITRNSSGRLLLNKTFEATATYNDANQSQTRDVEDRNPFTGVVTRRREDLRYERRGSLRQDATYDYTYDFLGRLVEASPRSGGASVRIHWDGFGRRIRQGELRYTYWGDDVIAEEPDSGAWSKHWIYGCKPGELVAYRTNLGGTDRTLYAHLARTGNVEFLSDASGAIVERYAMDPFGTPTLFDGNGQPLAPGQGSGNALLMHGQYYSAELNLYFVGPRVYHPYLGRFIQRDPAGLMADALAHRNPYVYAGNNPENFADDGNLAWFVIPVYIGAAALMALAETGVEAAIDHRYTPPGAPSQFSFGKVYLRNLGINLATNWIPGSGPVRGARAFVARRAANAYARRAISHLIAQGASLSGSVRHVARMRRYVGWAAGGAAAYGLRTGAATALEYGVEQVPAIGTGRGFGSILLGNVAGDLVGLGIRRALARFSVGARLGYSPPGTRRSVDHPGWHDIEADGIGTSLRFDGDVLNVRVGYIDGTGRFLQLRELLRGIARRGGAQRVCVRTTEIVEESGKLLPLLQRRFNAVSNPNGGGLLFGMEL